MNLQKWIDELRTLSSSGVVLPSTLICMIWSSWKLHLIYGFDSQVSGLIIRILLPVSLVWTTISCFRSGIQLMLYIGSTSLENLFKGLLLLIAQIIISQLDASFGSWLTVMKYLFWMGSIMVMGWSWPQKVNSVPYLTSVVHLLMVWSLLAVST